MKNLKKIAGLKTAICQMPVIAGDPRANTEYVISEIAAAEKRGCDIVAFPEMGIPGYVIGDRWEDGSFINDVGFYNEAVREATAGKNIAVIFGSLDFDPQRRSEDGRERKFNAAIVVKDGKRLGSFVKTLQPNYRIFDDDRHFFSNRKNFEEFRAGEASECPSPPRFQRPRHRGS